LESIGARLAHDLKTPLSIIKCLAQLLAPAVESEGPRRQVEVLTTEVERMHALIEDHLSFARPLVALAPSSLALGALVDDVLGLLRSRAQLDGVALRREGVELEVVAHRRMLRDALVSFVSNALEATPAGGSVAVSVGPAVGGARVVVRDTGRGMSAEERARVGTPCCTTRADGTGLGVVLARAAVRQHGGDVRIENAPGAGTAVTIALPGMPAAAPG
jgi:signal transduction histidine kinase